MIRVLRLDDFGWLELFRKGALPLHSHLLPDHPQALLPLSQTTASVHCLTLHPSYRPSSSPRSPTSLHHRPRALAYKHSSPGPRPPPAGRQQHMQSGTSTPPAT